MSTLPLVAEVAFARKRQLHTLADRLAAIYQVRVSPSKLVAYTSQVVGFSAIGTDATPESVQGSKFTWSTSDTSIISIDESGKATMLKPGFCWVQCSAGVVTQRVPVLVRPGPRPAQSMADWIKDQNSLSPGGSVTPGGMARLLDSLAPTAEAQNNSYAGDYLWNYTPNLTANPRNRMIVPTRIGACLPESSNFNLPVQLVSLQGRGLSLSLTAYYNSRLWFRNGSSIIYNPLGGFPAPGFNLGFGYIVTYNSSSPPYDTAYAFVDRDGTFRYLGHGNPNSYGTYQTQDGTHITFTGYIGGGTLSYTDGTQVTISVVNNNLLPTQVMDRNGNYETIAYKDATQGYNPLAIDFITDTLGRNVQFNYDANLNLSYITVPAMNGGTQNSVFFYYTSHTLSYHFNGLTPLIAGSSGPFLNNIEITATNTGCTLSYSDYGMAYNVSLRSSMNMPGGNGSESASMNFNYPTSGSTVLTDAPAFTQYSDSPGGTYSISSSTNSGNQTLTYTVARPDSSTLSLTRSTNTSSVANGLVTQAQINNSSGASMAQSTFAYVNDPGGSPQVQSVIGADDAGNQTQINYDYNSTGFVTNKREFGFQQSGSWVVRRRTHVNYASAGGATVPTEVDLYDAQLNTNDADDVMIAKTTYDIDNYNYPAPLTGMEDYAGTASPPNHYSSFDATYTSRGNISAQTQWTDITANLSITRQTRLDIFGNTTKAQVACCSLKTLTMDQTTYWTSPTQITSGDPSSINLTDTAAYDFNTGKPTQATDPNNLSVTYSYDADLRPVTANLPTGATASASFNDASMYATSGLSYTDGGVNKSVSQTIYKNGWGWITKTVDQAGNAVNYSYNNMGQLQSNTNPFPQNGSPGPSTSYQYDALGRQTLSTLPDGNTVQTSYNGSTVTVTDPVGRKIQRQVDGLGRLVAFIDQDPASGALTQITSYAYNYLDEMTQSNQGGPLRSWKYDALGRLLYERIPEQSATINDGTGTMWSTKYTRTAFGAVSSWTDARGVVVNYGFDAMNRMTSIGYDTSHATGVAFTPNVAYNYDNSSTSSTKGLLLSVTVGSFYQESYGYDLFNDPSSITDTIDGKSYTTSYQSNSAGQVTQITYPSTRILPIAYDNAGRLSSIGATQNNPTGYISGFAYNAAEMVTGFSLGNGVSESFGYDANRLQLTSQQATKGSTSLMNLTYSYAAQAGQTGVGTVAGNANEVMSVNGAINQYTETTTNTYDNDLRLVTSSQTSNGMNAQRRIVWDRWDNRTSVYNAVTGGTQIQSVTLQQSGGVPTNRITSITNNGSTLNYTYDAAGNVTNDGINSYTYDAENRLVSVNAGATAQYAYDYSHRRIKKVASGVTTHYIWKGDRVLAEHNGSTGALVNDYIVTGKNFIAKVSGSGAVTYSLSDRLGERLVLDSGGNVLGAMATLPFGEDFAETGQQENHHFTTYPRNSETGLDYAVNREYSASTGRYLQVDPYRASQSPGAPHSSNRYTYVEDPINFTDPTGLDGVNSPTIILPLGCSQAWGADIEGNLFPIVDGATGTPVLVCSYAVVSLVPTPGGGSSGGGQLGPCDPKVFDDMLSKEEKNLAGSKFDLAADALGGWLQDIVSQLDKAGLDPSDAGKLEADIDKLGSVSPDTGGNARANRNLGLDISGLLSSIGGVFPNPGRVFPIMTDLANIQANIDQVRGWLNVDRANMSLISQIPSTCQMNSDEKKRYDALQNKWHNLDRSIGALYGGLRGIGT
jgi:RHS repeat-associated protein